MRTANIVVDLIGVIGVLLVGWGLLYLSVGLTLAWLGFVCMMIWALAAFAPRR
jgi:hypothetical protein